MKKSLLVFTLSTVVGFAMSACGSGGDDLPSTIGGLCDETGAAMCESATKCSSLPKSTCVSVFVYGCCQKKGKCDFSMPPVDASVYAKCKSDLARMSCSDITNEKMPSSCESL
jgi:hypothetical protein